MTEKQSNPNNISNFVLQFVILHCEMDY